MKLLPFLTVLLFASPCFADELPSRAAPSEDVVIQTSVNGQKIVAQPNERRINLEDVQNVVATKEKARVERIIANKKMDVAYKMIPNKPSKVFHPMRRADLWIDYHQDRFRKYRTRDLPVGQGAATVIGMVFSICAALR
jgi:hypothetical protein